MFRHICRQHQQRRRHLGLADLHNHRWLNFGFPAGVFDINARPINTPSLSYGSIVIPNPERDVALPGASNEGRERERVRCRSLGDRPLSLIFLI